MDIIESINQRRSIRKFQNKIVSKEIIEQLLILASKAPSGKNRQPWRFVILQNENKTKLANVMEITCDKFKKKNKSLGSFELSINSIKEAPTVILVFNTFSKLEEDYNHNRLLTDTQSIGASIQTLLLAAQNFDLGSLWICDVLQCSEEIGSWLNCKEELVAAVAIGYPNQSPYPRPRKSIEDVIEWL